MRERLIRWLFIVLTVVVIAVTWLIPGPPPLALRAGLGIASVAAYAWLLARGNKDAVLEYLFAVTVWTVAIRGILSMVWIMVSN